MEKTGDKPADQVKAEIKALLFDKDGTLFDFQATWGEWTKNYIQNITANEARALAMAHAVGIDWEAASFAPDSPIIAGSPEEMVEVMLPFATGYTSASLLADIYRSTSQATQVPATDLTQLLCAFKDQGYAIGVATNDAEAPARANLRHAGIEELFDFIAGFDSGHGAKPEPGMLRAFAAAMGCAPDAVLMIGDSTHDLAAAKAARMPAVGVLTGIAAAQELAPHAEAVLPSIASLPAWLEERKRTL